MFEPNILLMDEPTASLDPINIQILIEILNDLNSRGITIGVASQDMSFVNKIADDIYLVESGQIRKIDMSHNFNIWFGL